MFDQFTCKCTHLPFSRLAIPSAMRRPMQDLAVGTYTLLWCMLPPRQVARTDRWKRFKQLIDAAREGRTPAVMLGASESSLWRSDVLEQLIVDGTLRSSTHAWCHFGVTLWEGEMEGPRARPSARKHRMLTNFHVHHSSCTCPPNTEHYHDTVSYTHLTLPTKRIV